jgi:hypothetical protein
VPPNASAVPGRRESAYDKLLLLMHLDLEPFPGAAFFVKRTAVLGYNSFESPALGNAISGKAILRQTARKPQDLLCWLPEGSFELVSAAREWFGSKISTITINTIKNGEALRNIPSLKQLKARNLLRVERNNLTVQKHRSVPKLTYRGGDARKCGGPVEIVSRQ